MKRKKKTNWLCLTLALLLVLACPAVVYGDEEDDKDREASLAPYFVI